MLLSPHRIPKTFPINYLEQNSHLPRFPSPSWLLYEYLNFQPRVGTLSNLPLAKSKDPLPFVPPFSHPLSEQITLGLHVRYCVRSWGYSAEQKRQDSCPWQFTDINWMIPSLCSDAFPRTEVFCTGVAPSGMAFLGSSTAPDSARPVCWV